MEGVFINYRRDDSSGWANRLHRDLVDRFGADRVFRDLNLEPGINFKKAIAQRLRQCKVQMVLIGRQWLTITDSKGRVRIQKADDLVRAEIAIALASSVRVIPVLVQDADMPTAEDLPEDIRGLAELNAVELSDRRWDHDTKELMDVIAQILGVSPLGRDPQPEVLVSPAAPSAVPHTSRDSPHSRRSLVIRLWWFASALLFLGFAFLSMGICAVLDSSVENRRGTLALFGACWGLASWLPVARIVGLRGQSAHVFLAVLSWMVAWQLAWPSSGVVGRDGSVTGRLSQLLFEYSQQNATFHLRLLALGAIGATGSIVAVYLRLLWYKEVRREVPLLGLFWSLAVYLSFVIVVDVVTARETQPEYRGVDVVGALAIALAIGSSVAAGMIGYWDTGNSVIRAIKSIPQSNDPRAQTKQNEAPQNPPQTRAETPPNTET